MCGFAGILEVLLQNWTFVGPFKKSELLFSYIDRHTLQLTGAPRRRPRGASTAADLRRLRQAAGRGSVCVCVCNSKLDFSGLVVMVLACVDVHVSVCSFVWLFCSLFPWLVGWLVLFVSACVFFGNLRYMFMFY